MKGAAFYSLSVLLVALAAGCGSSAQIVSPQIQIVSPPIHTRLGSLVVGIKLAGGPASAVGRLIGGHVAIFNRYGRLIDARNVKEGHTAMMKLAPGHYSVGLGPGRASTSTKRFRGCRPKIATVTGGHTTHYTLWYGCLYR